MPWCPHCKTEYRNGFTQCADCGAPLVEQLPEEPSSDPIQPVLLMHCPSTFDADATVALLRSFEIACFSQPDSGGEKAYTGISLTGETIYVEQTQAEQAREIIRGFRRGHSHIDEEDAEALLAQTKEQEPPEPSSGFLSEKLPRIALLMLAAANLLYFLIQQYLQ